jgi:cyclic beta-1,2-glucan synthetase
MAHDSSAPEIDTTEEVGQAGDGVLTENPVDALGHRLAGEYALARKLTREPRLLYLLDHQERRLDHAYQRFSNAAQADVAPSYAAEWLLDNYFVVQQAIRQVREDMPLGYYQQLPKLKNTSWATYPRVYALARESIAYSNCQLHIGDTVRLIQAFQADGESLTMGELWAFPTMLRLGILDSLTSALSGVVRGDVPTTPAIPPVADETIVSACITSLRALAVQDWKSFFESVCVVEQLLRLDPAGVYPAMDFDTRNSYRTAIEHLARLTKQREDGVAHQAIALSAEALSTAQMTHVGYYLLGAGRRHLEDRLQSHPSWSIALNRWLVANRVPTYLGSIGSLVCVLVFASMTIATVSGARLPQVIGVGLLTVLPFAAVAVSLVHWAITHRVSPRLLPRMDFRDGIPIECQTMVVIPTLLTTTEEIDSLLQQLELHFLRNADPYLYFALLTDYDDAPSQHMPDDAAVISHTQAGIAALNSKYERDAPPFYLFHRGRQWNALQDSWMGWERKRGKLVEFNRLLRGDATTSYSLQLGDLSVLPSIQYVITLDSDSILPEDSARRLVATLAHPLNRAEYDPLSGKVVAGYGVLQPRIEVTPTSANQSRFTQTFAGDVGLDLYTRAVSDVYQDVFGEGIYVGKGIYAVDVFAACVADRIPENALLSHDLFEGLYARVALVTDIVLLEEYPARYLGHTRRLHRWIRGDWQLLPWLLPRVPTGQAGVKARNALSVLDRWKILDNLRRSLLAPALLALLVAAWLGLIGTPLLWTLVGLGSLGVSLVLAAFAGLRYRTPAGTLGDTLRPIRTDGWRWLLAVAFLPYEAFVTLNAIASTLVRMFLTRKHLLRWTTAARTAQHHEADRSSRVEWREMVVAPSLAGLLCLVIGALNLSALPLAIPLLVMWFISPQIAYWISRPNTRQEPMLSADQEVALHYLARQTWLFFEQTVGPEDHWLPPDHVQETPRVMIAHSTSPTNIGMCLLSTVAAYDLGYMGPLDVVARLQATFDTIDKLEHHRGHLLNWYNTQSLEPLLPRYVSTVDSGNWAGCLVVIKQACLAIPDVDALGPQRWQGLLDTLGLLEDSLHNLRTTSSDVPVKALSANTASLRQHVQAVLHTPEHWASLVSWLNQEAWAELSRLIVAVLESEASSPNAEMLSNLRITSERFHRHVTGMQRDLDLFLPWLLPLSLPPALFAQLDSAPSVASAWQELVAAIPAAPHLRDLLVICETAHANVKRLQNQLQEGGGSADQLRDALTWCDHLSERLDSTRLRVQALLADYANLAIQAETQFQAMDFSFLFNTQRRVFHIGYNAASGTLDDNCYDLLASEARLGSLLAIAKRDVPQSHWLHLGRPITSVVNVRTLLSWSGTMFEYLMPTLLMESYEHTFLTQSCRAAVDYQIAYGHEKNVPWGISESSYYAFDANMTYQYRAFGVPGLGFKRGLTEDLVITPYASLLALRTRPQAVRQNMDRLDAIGMRGRYGFYEAVDYSRSRLSLRQDHALVRSYMAHHQGMILLSLTNYLQHDLMIQRFHADPVVRSVEMLLQEKVPNQAPIEYPHHEEIAAHARRQAHVTLAPWPAPDDALWPQVHVLSNGRLSTLITGAGSGYSQWQGLGLTRWQADTTRDNAGTWVYLQDQESGDVWSAGHQPSCVISDSQQVLFYAHQAEFQRRDHDIGLQMHITIAADDDVEIRQLTLINHGTRPRHLRLVSYGEVQFAAQTEQHPAFNKLFIESEYLPESNMLLFHRRPRSADEEPIYVGHLLVTNSVDAVSSTYDGDRMQFLGRGMTTQAPAALQQGGLGLSQHVGVTLDPIMSLGHDLVLEPHATARVAYLTLATRSRPEALTLASRYSTWSAITRAFDSARRQNELALRQLDLGTPQLALIQQVLAALLYPHAGLRASADVLAANAKGQAGLWAYSISGDYPILLVRISDAAELTLIQDLLQAHSYWRSQQLMIDLVILNLHDTSYSQELQGQLHRLMVRSNSTAWLNQRGGIFTLHADQMNEADRVLLQTTARVVLDGRKGSLAEQLARSPEDLTPLPILTATRSTAEVVEMTPPLARPSDLRFDNGWGGFSADGNEYVIYLESGQWTPAPWVNVIANETFGCLVSEAGAGYTWAENSSQNRLTPWSNDPVTDTSGEALYLRDEETAHVWSPTPLPSRDTEPYVIRHGAGYSLFQHHSQGLKQDTLVFVAPEAPVKIIKLRLENVWHRPRRITVTYYAEWVLGVTHNASQLYIVSEYDHTSGALLARNAYNAEFGERVAFLAANKVPHGLTADRTEFLGHMGSLSHPDALSRIGLTSRVEPGGDPCAVLQLHIDLPVGGSEEVFFLLGEGTNKQHALQLIQHYQDSARVEAAWHATNASWDSILGAVTVHTPEPAMDIMLNRWLLYQALSCRIWGRSGFYQSSGAFGYRDQLQDVMALMLAAPDIAHDHILRAAHHQFDAGDVLHWWHPPSGRGVRTRISDDMLWLPFVVAHYIETTGDVAILQEEVPFLHGDALQSGEEERYGQFEATSEKYTLYEHCLRAIKRGSTAGAHGLPLMGTGDWNDGMNRVGAEGRGESVWVGWFLYRVLTSVAPLCEHMGDANQANTYREQAQRLKTALDTEAWDGHWYRRAYFDDGTPLGAAQNSECQIDSIVQSWAVLSGAGDPDRIVQAMAAVAERLIRVNDQLVLLFTPAFDKTRHDPGYVKGYPPGLRENGGQYTHAAVWTAWAFAQLGQGNRALEIFRLLNPISHSDTHAKAGRYRVEPYVIAADVYSVAPHTGRGGWTWYTGSSSWMYRLGVEAILGLKRRGDSLEIDPCIPHDWAQYELTYRDGETHYVIRVKNPHGVHRGVIETRLDGHIIPGGPIPLLRDRGTHEIHIELGNSAP